MTATRKAAGDDHDRNACDPLDTTIDRVRSEYREMPGLRLTLDQMGRLWMLDSQTCRILVEKLIEAEFLEPTRDGQYVRSDFRSANARR
jgi:hypothetical protein